MGAESALAGTFVARRGAVVAGGAMAAGGLVGVAIAARADKKGAHSPLGMGQIGYLAVGDDALTLYATKRGAFKPKISDEVVAQIPRSELSQSRLKKGKLAHILELDFNDGSGWEFDVGRVFRKGVEEVASLLGSKVD